MYTAQLASRVNRLSNERDWFLITTHPDGKVVGDPKVGQVRGYWPRQVGDASMRACETWLANRGFRVRGNMPPEIFEYETV